ncbi:MAG: hypothetical protein IT291_05015 [Deltaproteobacteria bacterium]|nr:hypothetical protein [Deltaproteobacteria bacterium]
MERNLVLTSHWCYCSPPPTLMHTMVAISILFEGGAIATGLFILVVGADNIGLAQAVMYGLCAVIGGCPSCS